MRGGGRHSPPPTMPLGDGARIRPGAGRKLLEHNSGVGGKRATHRATRRHHRGRRRDLPVAVPAAELRSLHAGDVRHHGVATGPVQRPARRAFRRHLPAERVAGGPGVAPLPDVAVAAVRRSARRLVLQHALLRATAAHLRGLGDRHWPHLLVGPHQGSRRPRQGRRAGPFLRHPRRGPGTGRGAPGDESRSRRSRTGSKGWGSRPTRRCARSSGCTSGTCSSWPLSSCWWSTTAGRTTPAATPYPSPRPRGTCGWSSPGPRSGWRPSAS